MMVATAGLITCYFKFDDCIEQRASLGSRVRRYEKLYKAVAHTDRGFFAVWSTVPSDGRGR